MFVSTSLGSIRMPRKPASPAASFVARAWSSGRRLRSSSSADERRRRDDARLPHSAAEELPDASRLGDEVLRSRHRAPDRGSQPFREARHDGVEPCRERRFRHAERRGGVPEARAVEVDLDPVLLRESEERLGRLARRHDATRAIVRVLEREDRRARQVVDGLGPDPRGDLIRRDPPADAVDRARQEPRQRRHPRHLVVEDVAPPLEDDLRARARVDAQRELVAHRAGRDEERGLVPEDLGGLFLEEADGRVFPVDVVADLGLGHGLPHARRGFRDGVGAEVGDGNAHAPIIPERARRGRGGSRRNRFCLPARAGGVAAGMPGRSKIFFEGERALA